MTSAKADTIITVHIPMQLKRRGGRTLIVAPRGELGGGQARA